MANTDNDNSSNTFFADFKRRCGGTWSKFLSLRLVSAVPSRLNKPHQGPLVCYWISSNSRMLCSLHKIHTVNGESIIDPAISILGVQFHSQVVIQPQFQGLHIYIIHIPTYGGLESLLYIMLIAINKSLISHPQPTPGDE